MKTGSVANFPVIRVWHEATSVSGDDNMFKGRHFDRSVILLCVRWYLAYSLSLRDLNANSEGSRPPIPK